jgi:8-hydroxy-5-deazaflavin:NADPH oxidoreductase
MKIGVLGSGMVGVAIATKLVKLGHEVKMGSRSATNEDGAKWVAATGKGASQGTFKDAAAFGELLFNCTSGSGSLPALESAGKDALGGKILVDIANPLDFSGGMPPRLSVVNDDSLGEQIQRAYPNVKVVKTLNTVNANLMVEPGLLKDATTMFLCGDDAASKGKVQEILKGWFGWQDTVDLGPIAMARGTEMYLALWVRLYGALQNPMFNVKLVR